MKMITTFLLCFCHFYPSVSFAHPHLFVDSIATLKQVSGETLVSVEWIFDHWHSQGLIMDFDVNGDGKLSALESKELLDGLKKNLGKYSHFGTLKVNGNKLKFTVANNRLETKEVEIKGEDGKPEKVSMFHYHYDLKFSAPKELKIIDLIFYDDTMYSAISSRGKMNVDKNFTPKKSTIKKDLCEYHLEF